MDILRTFIKIRSDECFLVRFFVNSVRGDEKIAGANRLFLDRRYDF